MAREIECTNCRRVVQPQKGRCPYCDAILDLSHGDAWSRSAEQIAVRLDQGRLQGILKTGFSVPEGSMAVLLKGGQVEEILSPGHHEVSTLREKLQNFLKNRQIEVILVNASDFELTFRVGKSGGDETPELASVRRLLTKENADVAIDCSLRLRIERPEMFINGLLAGKHELRARALGDRCTEEVAQSLSHVIREFSTSDLDGGEAVRTRVEQELEKQLRPWLGSLGITLVRLIGVRFDSKTLDRMRREDANLHELKAGEAFAKRLDTIQREGLTRETLRELFERRTDSEKLEMLAQLEEKDLLNQQNLDIVKRTIVEEAEDQELARDFFKTRTQLLNQNELESIELAHRKGQTQLEIEIGQLKEAAQREQDELDWDLARKIREEKSSLQIKEQEEQRRVEREDELARTDHRAQKISEMSARGPEALIAFMDDASRAAMLAELQKTSVLKGMTEEQILAMSAGESSAVAEAFKERFRSLGSGRVEEMYEKMLHDQKGFSEQLQGMFGKALDSQSSASTGVAAGAGPKDPGFMGVHVAGGAGGTLICPSCSTGNPASANHCVNCGHKLRGSA